MAARQLERTNLEEERGEQIKAKSWTLAWCHRPHILSGKLWPPGSTTPSIYSQNQSHGRFGLGDYPQGLKSRTQTHIEVARGHRDGDGGRCLGTPPPHQPQGVRLGLSSVTSECPAREEMVLTVTH